MHGDILRSCFSLCLVLQQEWSVEPLMDKYHTIARISKTRKHPTPMNMNISDSSLETSSSRHPFALSTHFGQSDGLFGVIVNVPGGSLTRISTMDFTVAIGFPLYTVNSIQKDPSFCFWCCTAPNWPVKAADGLAQMQDAAASKGITPSVYVFASLPSYESVQTKMGLQPGQLSPFTLTGLPVNVVLQYLPTARTGIIAVQSHA
jgi:hypothetical protein